MPRQPRLFVPEISAHVIQRGNNRSPIFSGFADYQAFLQLLRRHARRQSVAVHAYALMSNHYHLLLTPRSVDSVPRMMKGLNGGYVHYFNRQHQRIGTLWNGRYRAIGIDDERYWLTCLRYIEQNPARAGLTSDLATYEWCSYRFHAEPQVDSDWLTPHDIFLSLGRSELERRTAYRAMAATSLTRGEALPVL